MIGWRCRTPETEKHQASTAGPLLSAVAISAPGLLSDVVGQVRELSNAELVQITGGDTTVWSSCAVAPPTGTRKAAD